LLQPEQRQEPPVAAVLASLDMTADGPRCKLDSRHDIELKKAHVSGMDGPIPNEYGAGFPKKFSTGTAAAGRSTAIQGRPAWCAFGNRSRTIA
jgi:hypothetical protein